MGLFLNLEKICSFSAGAMGVGYIGYENSGTFFRFDEFFIRNWALFRHHGNFVAISQIMQ